ncbi:MAG: GGDEF domain-containing protein, partial [Proteobacteria bacterium]|nr:GGDEF domain-containing protein [Pseudomonadota bacterium]
FGRSSAAEKDAQRFDQQKAGVSDAITKLRGHIKILSERLIELDPDGSAEVVQHTHELTSLPSLKQFEIDIDDMAKSDDHPFTVAFVDIDNFKSINSRIGHGKADDVIKHLAAFLVEATFERAKVYHRSGDEFLLILENTTSKEAQLFLTRVIAEVKAENFPHLGKTISISIGTASFPEHSKDPATLKEQSNKAMLKAKEKKGSVVIFPSKP